MIVYYDAKRAYAQPRLHPYGAAEPNQTGHVDFKSKPELIRTSLEDFRPFADQPAVQTFYSFLEWINGPESSLETNDCAFRPPAPHHDANSPLDLSTHGRLFILYRNLALNSSQEHSDWLCGALMASLRHTDQELSAGEAVIGFTLTAALQTAISTGHWVSDSLFDSASDDPGLGRHLMLSFWAYGNTAEDAFGNLNRLFTNLWTACRMVSDEITRATSGEQPVTPPVENTGLAEDKLVQQTGS